VSGMRLYFLIEELQLALSFFCIAPKSHVFPMIAVSLASIFVALRLPLVR
jgi:hypothetical protein